MDLQIVLLTNDKHINKTEDYDAHPSLNTLRVIKLATYKGD